MEKLPGLTAVPVSLDEAVRITGLPKKTFYWLSYKRCPAIFKAAGKLFVRLDLLFQSKADAEGEQ